MDFSQLASCITKPTQTFEDALKSCKVLLLFDLWVKNHPALKEEVIDALEPMKALLQGIFVRLHLKDHNFSTFQAATIEDINKVQELIHQVDETVPAGRTKKVEFRGIPEICTRSL